MLSIGRGLKLPWRLYNVSTRQQPRIQLHGQTRVSVLHAVGAVEQSLWLVGLARGPARQQRQQMLGGPEGRGRATGGVGGRLFSAKADSAFATAASVACKRPCDVTNRNEQRLGIQRTESVLAVFASVPAGVTAVRSGRARICGNGVGKRS